MPNIYLSETMLPESRGMVRGGLAVVLHDPAEIDGLAALCALAPRPPEDPMASVYRALGDPSLDLAVWAAHWRDIEALRPAATTTSVSSSPTNAAEEDTENRDEPLPTGQLGKLRLALEVAKELWRAQEAETSLLSLVVLLAEPGRTGQGDLNLDGDGAALVIQPGSLVGRVMCLPLHVTSFAVCLVVGGGTSTSARRAEMVGRLREKALASGGAWLRDIRDLAPFPAGTVIPARLRGRSGSHTRPSR